MWLVYLRFEGDGQTKVGHVGASNKTEAENILKQARKPGASFPGSKLVEYEFFYSSGTIKRMMAPARPVFADTTVGASNEPKDVVVEEAEFEFVSKNRPAIRGPSSD